MAYLHVHDHTHPCPAGPGRHYLEHLLAYLVGIVELATEPMATRISPIAKNPVFLNVSTTAAPANIMLEGARH